MLDRAIPEAGVRRVLMTADTVGGVWTYALELTRAFAPFGVEVTLATMGAPLTPGQWEEARAPFILTAGRLWDEAKNVAALEAVAPRLGWPVKVAGESLHPLRGEAVPPRNVEPLGRLSPRELAGWMGRAAIYALPARYEPFGLSVLEAALAARVHSGPDVRGLPHRLRLAPASSEGASAPRAVTHPQPSL